MGQCLKLLMVDKEVEWLIPIAARQWVVLTGMTYHGQLYDKVDFYHADNKQLILDVKNRYYTFLVIEHP